jgi:hypothetical protein
MKLILSRKGFDSTYGGCASPIFEDDSMVSLPIPLEGAPHLMRDATSGIEHFDGEEVLADLTRRRHNMHTPVHLDPYLRRPTASAPVGWKPAFGQDGAAQGHLNNEQVGPGDLFLFFGWFRRVERHNGAWRFEAKSPNLHVIFGWLQVEEAIPIDAESALKPAQHWLADHPHIRHANAMQFQNTIYVASDHLVVNGRDMGVPGGGVFGRFSNMRQLTAPGAQRRTDWRLPQWFHPDHGHTLSYHRNNPHRWRHDQDRSFTRLQSVAKGQEFVIDLSGLRKGEAMNWLRALFELDKAL